MENVMLDIAEPIYDLLEPRVATPEALLEFIEAHVLFLLVDCRYSLGI